MNYENNLKLHSTSKENPIFLCADQSLLWHEHITNKKENYLKKGSELAATANIFRRSK